MSALFQRFAMSRGAGTDESAAAAKDAGDEAASATVRPLPACVKTVDTVVDALSEDEKHALTTVADKYGSNMHRIAVMPNHSFHDAWAAPSGVVYTFAAGTEIVPEGGDVVPARLGDGVAVAQVRARDGAAPLNDAYFEDRLYALRDVRVNSEMREDARVDTDLATPDAPLSLSLYGGPERIGVYKGYRGKETRYYMIVRAGAGYAAAQLARRANTGGFATYDDLHASKEYRDVCSLASRMRRGLLAHVASLLQVDPVGTVYPDRTAASSSAATDSATPLLTPEKEQMTHSLVRRVGMDKKPTYALYVNAYNTSDAKNGLVIGLSPQDGYVWLEGREQQSGVSAPWSNLASNAFPSGTGRACAHFSRSARVAAAKHQWMATCVADGPTGVEPGRVNERALDGVYRARSHAWKAVETKLGRDAAWGETEMRPVIQRIAETPSPAYKY
jgi:hypothetical protein